MCLPANQPAPQGSETLVVLHVTPQRATRALALRYILRSLGRPMDHLALLACPRKIREVEEGGLVLSAFTSDFGELLAGWQHVRWRDARWHVQNTHYF